MAERSKDNKQAADKRYPNGTGTIGKALDLLECFSIKEPRLTAGEIGSRLGLSTSTLYRYLTAMETEGYLEREADTNRYVIGLRVVELAGIALSRMEVRRHGQVELDGLANALDMNANMSVLYHGDIFHLAFSVRTEVDRMYAVIGRRTPAHCTAMGKTLLAYLPREEAHGLIRTYGWRPLTDRSIRDFERLDAELDEIVRNGYSVDRGEVNPKVVCVAAPVRDMKGGVIAAVSVSSARERIEADFDRVVHTVMHHADRTSLRLGYHVGQTFPTNG